MKILYLLETKKIFKLQTILLNRDQVPYNLDETIFFFLKKGKQILIVRTYYLISLDTKILVFT